MKRWSPAVRVAFRFVFSYFVLYFSTSYLSRLIPYYSELWHNVLERLAEIVRLGHEVELQPAGISDTAYGWMLFLCYLVVAALAAAVWSILDSKREQYERLYAWLRLLLRMNLAFAMFSYGAIKTIPAQMISPPPVGVMNRPIGVLFPNHFLWWTVGASPVFETLTGLAELTGGVLLLFPRTTLLGAIICAGDMLFVFLLNVCFDVSVKLGSFHLLVMALVLIAKDGGRLAGVFLFNRRVEPSSVAPLFRNKWLDRIPHVLLFVYGLHLIDLSFDRSLERYRRMHPPRPPHYGYWSVEEFQGDAERWRWVGFIKPGSFGVESVTGSDTSYPLDQFSLKQLESGVVVLEGQGIRAKLRRMPLIRDVPWPYRN